MRYAFGNGGRLCRLNLRTGKLTVLLDDPEGGVRDPNVHYDGQKILFSYRKAGTKTFHHFRDPYPLSEDLFLVADKEGLHLLTSDGQTETIYRPDKLGGRWDCHEPRPLRSRPREPVVTSRFAKNQPTGRLILSDIYAGRNMEGVQRGEIKKLLVLEQLPRPANFSNGQEPLTVAERS
jgi:hypothetical protein